MAGEENKPDSGISFDALWRNYPANAPCLNPTNGKKAYDNQCAIRLGAALEKSGASFKSFRGPRCEFGARGNGMVLNRPSSLHLFRSREFAGGRLLAFSMMRRPFSLWALACAALTSCLVGGFFFIRTFQAGDCDGGCNLSTLASIVAAAFAAFLSAGYALMKRREAKGANPYPLLIALSAAVLAIPGLMLAVKGLLPAGPLRANQDNSYMLVAKRDVPGIGIAAGDRCIFSRIDCSAAPARIDAVCTRGAITLEESLWSAFARLPQEDFGLPPGGAVQAFPSSCPKR